LRQIVSVTLFLVLFSGMVSAENSAAIGGDLGVYSAYVWRGLVFDEKPVLQTDVWMEVDGISMVFWGNCDLTDEDNEFIAQYNEWDVYLSFPLKSYKYLTLGGEIDYLSFPSSSGFSGASTSEISGWVETNFPGSPRLQVFWDVWQWHGIYANFSVTHSLELGPGVLIFNGAAGWGNANHNRQSGVAESGGLLDVFAGVAYDWSATSWLTLTPAVSFTSILQNDIRDFYNSEDIDINPSRVFFSINAAVVKP